MGMNTTVLILNDGLHSIETHPEFCVDLADAIKRKNHGSKEDSIDVPVGPECNAVQVVETHHSDEIAVVAIGMNYASVIGRTWGMAHHGEYNQLRLMKEILREKGYNIVKRRD